MTLRIRAATTADRDVVHQLLTAQMIEHRLPSEPERIARGLEAAFKPGSPAWMFLAEREGRAVGVFLANRIVSVEKGGETLWIEELYVTPEARRSGVARTMLSHVRDHARRRGLRAFDLEVVPTQAAAFALYRSLGFRDVPRQRLSLDL
jgi:ribosomal protein S18 acetylase RimI-like enzyme